MTTKITTICSIALHVRANVLAQGRPEAGSFPGAAGWRTAYHQAAYLKRPFP